MHEFYRVEELSPFNHGKNALATATGRGDILDDSIGHGFVINRIDNSKVVVKDLGIMPRWSYETKRRRQYVFDQESVAAKPEIYQYRPVFYTDAVSAAYDQFIALLFRTDLNSTVIRVIDVEKMVTIATVDWKVCAGLALNGNGKKLLLHDIHRLVGWTDFSQAEPHFQIDFPEKEKIRSIAWSPYGWVVGIEGVTQSVIRILAEDTGEQLREYQLVNEISSFEVAQTAPIIACSVGNDGVQIVNLDTGVSTLFRPYNPTTRYNYVRLAISADGLRVVTRDFRNDRF